MVYVTVRGVGIEAFLTLELLKAWKDSREACSGDKSGLTPSTAPIFEKVVWVCVCEVSTHY